MWKDIENWEEYYEVSDQGEVRNKKTGNILTGDINNAGYYRITLYHSPKKQRFFRHRLVAEAFISNPNGYKEINHKDGNKENNSVENLEWCDRTHNEREAHRNSIKEYKSFEVKFLNGEIKKYEFAIDLANELGLTRRCIQNYLHGKSQGYTNYGISEFIIFEC